MNTIAAELTADAVLVEDALHLGLGDCTLRLRSNSVELLAGLRDYFGHVVVAPRDADLEVTAIEREAPDLARIRFNPGRILRQRRSSRIRWA